MSSIPTPPITLLTTNNLALMLRSLRKRKGWTQSYCLWFHSEGH